MIQERTVGYQENNGRKEIECWHRESRWKTSFTAGVECESQDGHKKKRNLLPEKKDSTRVIQSVVFAALLSARFRGLVGKEFLSSFNRFGVLFEWQTSSFFSNLLLPLNPTSFLCFPCYTCTPLFSCVDTLYPTLPCFCIWNPLKVWKKRERKNLVVLYSVVFCWWEKEFVRRETQPTVLFLSLSRTAFDSLGFKWPAQDKGMLLK